MKRLASLLLIATLLGACASRRAQAQTYTIPQSTSTVATMNCGSVLVVQNVGQSTHSLSYQVSLGTGNSSIIWIEGSNNGVFFDSLSETGVGLTGQLIGFGYRTIMRIHFLCFVNGVSTSGGGVGFVVAQYAGTSAPASPVGSAIESTVRKLVCLGCAAATTQILSVYPPYGSTSGTVIFTYAGAGPANSTLNVAMADASIAGTTSIGTYPLATTTGALQVFKIPNFPMGSNVSNAQTSLVITYTSGGASASTFKLFYYFDAPGYLDQSFSALNIAGNASTAVKVGLGVLSQITVNTKGTTSTATVYDGVIGGGVCTGTKIGTIDTTASQLSLFFNAQFNAGLCVTTAGGGAADITVSFK
jgi:uncharacterized lipoprotein YbaY